MFICNNNYKQCRLFLSLIHINFEIFNLFSIRLTELTQNSYFRISSDLSFLSSNKLAYLKQSSALFFLLCGNSPSSSFKLTDIKSNHFEL